MRPGHTSARPSFLSIDRFAFVLVLMSVWESFELVGSVNPVGGAIDAVFMIDPKKLSATV